MTDHSTSRTHQNYIGGVWCDSVSGQHYPIVNPAHTTQVVGQFQASLPQDAENAIAAASNPPRAAILRRWRRRASWRSARGEGARRARR